MVHRFFINKVNNFKELTKIKNLRILWAAEGINLIGDAFFSLAVMWLVYAETESMLYSSVIVVAMHLTYIIASPLTGLVTDRFNRKHILCMTTLYSGLIMLGTAVAIYIAGEVTLTIALISIVASNLGTSFYTNARASITPDIVTREVYTQTLGLFGIINQFSDIIGRLLAGSLIVVMGPVGAVLVNSVALLFASVLITRLDFSEKRFEDGAIEYPDYRSMLVEGWKAIKGHPYLLSLLYITMLVNLSSFFMPFYPALVYDRLDGNAFTLSLISIVGIIGGITGGIISSNIEKKLGIGKVYTFSVFVSGITIIILGLSTHLLLTLIAEYILIISLTVNGIMFQAIISLTVESELRGRVIGLTGVIVIILVPVANLVAGFIGDIVGVSIMFLIAGVWLIILTPFIMRIKNLFQAKL